MSETLILNNFVRFLTTLFLLAAAAKAAMLSRQTTWDGWNIMTLSIALLTISSVLGMFKQFGANLAIITEALMMASGILAALSFLMSTKLIKKASKGS